MTRGLQPLHLTDLHRRGDPWARMHRWHVPQAFEIVLANALAR